MRCLRLFLLGLPIGLTRLENVFNILVIEEVNTAHLGVWQDAGGFQGLQSAGRNFE